MSRRDAINDARRFLESCIADLDAEIDRKTTDRTRLIAALQLLGAFAIIEVDGVEHDDPPEPPARRAPRPPGAPRRSPVYRDVICPECGETKGSAAALTQHRRHKHPTLSAVPDVKPPFDIDAARARAAESI